MPLKNATYGKNTALLKRGQEVRDKRSFCISYKLIVYAKNNFAPKT
jgi:hypothetical protein